MILSHIKQFLYQFWSALICSKGPPCFQPPICSALPVFIKKWPQNVLIHNIQEHPRCFTQRGSVLTKLLVWKSIYLSKPVKSSSVWEEGLLTEFLSSPTFLQMKAWEIKMVSPLLESIYATVAFFEDKRDEWRHQSAQFSSRSSAFAAAVLSTLLL